MFSDKFQDKTILIVEDDPFSIKLLSEYFSGTKATIIHAVNGVEAVDFAKRNPNINLILMDIKLPLKDGIEATKEIRIFREDLPIIAQTACALSSDINLYKTCGLNGYISKPYKKVDILNKVQNFLMKKLQVMTYENSYTI